jgi:hypothetical protein
VVFGRPLSKKICSFSPYEELELKIRNTSARHWWLTPVILATQEAEIRRIAAGSQPGQIFL